MWCILTPIWVIFDYFCCFQLSLLLSLRPLHSTFLSTHWTSPRSPFSSWLVLFWQIQHIILYPPDLLCRWSITRADSPVPCVVIYWFRFRFRFTKKLNMNHYHLFSSISSFGLIFFIMGGSSSSTSLIFRISYGRSNSGGTAWKTEGCSTTRLQGTSEPSLSTVGVFHNKPIPLYMLNSNSKLIPLTWSLFSKLAKIAWDTKFLT